MTLLIEALDVTRYYGKHRVVNAISFTLTTGQVLGFLGPNGAGKTTTMQMLTGNLAPSSGTIKINGFDIVNQAISAKQCIGYLPDTPPLYRDLTVLEYLRYCGKLHHISNNQLNKTVPYTLERCGLVDVQQRLIANLSKGLQQRVGIAQAILHSPKLIILDEPTVGLDPLQITEIRTLIRELGQDHGIILSTHRLSEVQEVCSHVQIIDKGTLLLNQRIDELNQFIDVGCIQIRTQRPADLDQVAKIPGVDTVTAITPEIFQVHYRLQANPTAELTELIRSQGWELV
ncbi:ABC transporter ATP-binding protein, partial [Methylocucumis oryzae]|uniref:ABC transporter ATP-binding protein n=1 Tax=Methylocucumis oryzae TaxID=1632867 RepID=UPI0006981896